MARNNGILVNDFRKMVLDGHINEVIKTLRYDEHDLVAQINKTLKIPSGKSNSREETFHSVFTNNVLSCPIDFVSIDVTTRQYPLNTVIYTFDVMYYNDAISHMDIDMSDYCHHKITISSVGLYTRKFSKWIMDVANDIRESMISAWKFAGNHAPDFIAAFDEVLDERKAEGIDINELYGADIPANDTEGDTSDTATKDSDDIGMKIITVKNPKDANKIIKTVTDFVKDFRKDPTSTADDLMDKINSFLDAEAIEHTIRDIEQETADDDGIQDEQSDPNREPEPDDDIHEPVEEESDEEECNEYGDCCDQDCCNCDDGYCDQDLCKCDDYDNGRIFADMLKYLISTSIDSKLMNNMNNHMIRNKLNFSDVNLIPGLTTRPLLTICNIMLSMSPFKVTASKSNTPLGGRVTIGVYNRENGKSYYNQVFDFSELTIEDVDTVKGIDMSESSRAVREQQLFDAVTDRILSELDLDAMFFAIGFAEGWSISDPHFNPNGAIINELAELTSSYINGAILTDDGDDKCDTDCYLDPAFAEWYNNMPEEAIARFGDDWDDYDDDDEDADYDDIMSETNGYFMTDIDSKED